MSTAPAGQDAAAVAVLKSQQQSLEASMRDLARTMSEGFAAINTKMDRVNDIALTLAQMSAQQKSHGDGLGRAFNEIESVRVAIERIEDDATQWRAGFAASVDDRFHVRDTFRHDYIEKHGKLHSEIDRKHALVKGITIGFGAAYALLVSLLTWAASTYIGETRENSRAIHQIQLEAARDDRR